VDILSKAKLLAHILRWRINWNRKDLEYKPSGINNPKFMTAMEAIKLIPDGATVFSSGLGGNTRCSVWFWATERSFRETGHPGNLTHINVGAQGGRGKVPGTIEEIAKNKGCVTRYIAGHLETAKAMLKLADEGRLELHTFPQGIESLLVEAQSRGIFEIETETGAGTFLDPRIGNGTIVIPGTGKSLTEASGNKLRYRLPKIDIAYFIAPAADIEGNIYIRNCCMFTESYESALAAKANGGKVLVSVAEITEKNNNEIFLPADKVDAVVVHPYNEQAASIPQLKYWDMFTEGANVDKKDAIEKLKFINQVLGITPKRGQVENALARLGGLVFTRYVKKCSNIVVGVGLPEEVSRLIYEGGLFEDITFISETGVIGGLPGPGIFFGAGINPKEIISSAQTFHLCYEHLDATILGILEADSHGNINVSKRGEGAINYVGPGGFPDFCAAADTIIFVGSWMAGAVMSIKNGKLAIDKPGKHKFIDRVSEITMSGEQALKKNKKVLYVTNVGVFKLTNRGMELIEVMPGIDIRKDITDSCPMKVVLPESGNVPLIDRSIVTGEGFKLKWNTTL
jgi:propionate CoA-transferase